MDLTRLIGLECEKLIIGFSQPKTIVKILELDKYHKTIKVDKKMFKGYGYFKIYINEKVLMRNLEHTLYTYDNDYHIYKMLKDQLGHTDQIKPDTPIMVQYARKSRYHIHQRYEICKRSYNYYDHPNSFIRHYHMNLDDFLIYFNMKKKI